MKVCSRCQQTKPLDEFYFRSREKRTRVAYCKPCSSLYMKADYAKNREYYREKARKSHQRAKEQSIEFLRTFLSEHPCVDCGETDILVLQFDHVKGRNFDVYPTNRSVAAIKREVKLCEVRCANCHVRRHILKSGSWKLRT